MRPVFDPVRPSTADVLALGRAHGLDAIGIAPAAPLLRARRAIEQRVTDGIDGGLPFTFRNPERSTDPSRAVAGAAAVVVGARRYLLADPLPPDAPPAAGAPPAEVPTGDVVVPEHRGVQRGPAATVARYAWIDHYAPLRESLRAVAVHLRRLGWKAVVFADDNSIVDREIAWLAGIGWFGKNANLLVPGAGSWFVLGCVITDAPLVVNEAPVPDGCGGCRRCFDGCPTAAIIEPGVIDANRCLAWLLQRPGTFPAEFRAALGSRIYGCDDCQEVCPPNIRLGRPRAQAPDSAVAEIPVLELLTISDDLLMERCGRWYTHQRQPRWIRRNALVVLGNIGSGADPASRRVLARYLSDEDPMLRAHAVWAARRLGCDDLLSSDDDADEVRAELERPVEALNR